MAPEVSTMSKLRILWSSRAHPSMRLSFPETEDSRPKPAMLVFRGGGYAYSSGSGGGTAQWAAEHGMVGIEVEYRTSRSQEYFPENYADAARAEIGRAHV